MENGGKWQAHINNGWVNNILIINNNLYGIGKDKTLYIHPIKEEKVEEFTNYISPFNRNGHVFMNNIYITFFKNLYIYET